MSGYIPKNKHRLIKMAQEWNRVLADDATIIIDYMSKLEGYKREYDPATRSYAISAGTNGCSLRAYWDNNNVEDTSESGSWTGLWTLYCDGDSAHKITLSLSKCTSRAKCCFYELY